MFQLALALLAYVIVVMALDKPSAPTADYRAIMFANASLVDLAAGGAGAGGDSNVDLRVKPAAGSQTLRELADAKDYEGLAKSTQALKTNYEKLNAFWAAKNVEDAVNLIKAGMKAASDLEMAAQAKSDKDIDAAQSAIEKTCRDCHTLHRVIILTDSSFQIRVGSNTNTATN